MSKSDFLIRRLVDGLSGWLVYQQAAKTQCNSEYSLYAPIEHIATLRGWKVVQQQKLVRTEGAAGAPKQVDFLFYREPTMARGATVVLEVKYLRASNASADRAALVKDMNKLSSISLENLQGFEDSEEFVKPKRFLLVAAQRSPFLTLTKSTSGNGLPAAKLLKKALREDKPEDVYETTAITHLTERIEWIVAAFGERAWANLIQQAD